MSDRVSLTSPTGLGVARVAKARVEQFKANGWREVKAAKPARAPRKPSAKKAGDEAKPAADEK